MTRQQQAWKFPPAEMLELSDKSEVANSELPPLPATVATQQSVTPSPAPKIFSLDTSAKSPSGTAIALKTDSAPKPLPVSAITSARPIPVKTESAVIRTSAAIPQESALPKPETRALPAPLSREATRGIVNGLVNASSTLATIDVDADTQDEKPPRLVDPLIKQASVEKPVEPAKTPAKPTEIVPELKPPQIAHSQKLPPIEALPPARPESSPIQISKVAVCRSVTSRGNFLAMPAEKLVPGTPLLIYWEMDGLTRRKSDHGTQLSLTVELVKSDREQIVASVRESLDKTGPAPTDGDFAVLRWQLPSDVTAGDYRIRVTANDLNGKSRDEAEVALSLLAPPQATSAD